MTTSAPDDTKQTPSRRRRRLAVGFGAEDAGEFAQLWWAGAGIVAMVLALVLAGWMFVAQPGSRTFYADMTGTGGLDVNSEVRVAGVPVGKVTGLELIGDHVEMSFTVATKVDVGDQSSLEIRMISPVGGFYLSLAPAGARPLGRTHIPADRVRLPFQIPELLQTVTPVVNEIDAEGLHSSLAKIDQAIAGAPGAVGTILDATHQLIDVVAQQQGQLTSIMAMTNEYLGVVNDNRSLVKTIIDNLVRIEPQLIANRDAVHTMVAELISMLTKIMGFLAGPYKDRIEPLLGPLKEAYGNGQELQRQLEAALGHFRYQIDTLAGYLGPNGQIYIDASRAAIDGPALCVPIPGQGC
ncbi:MlaD family protein [Nocardia beijingensis]|uniref:MlaD family protein n=1 Tax=Nocardia beijingensis TaxID=95162 RepID=UPI0033BCFBC8